MQKKTPWRLIEKIRYAKIILLKNILTSQLLQSLTTTDKSIYIQLRVKYGLGQPVDCPVLSVDPRFAQQCMDWLRNPQIAHCAVHNAS